MDTHTSERRLHPLMVAAAVSLIIFCGVGVAAISGLIPQVQGSSKDGSEAVAAMPVEALTDAESSANKAPACSDCGTVVAVNAIAVQGKTNGVGAVGGAVVGGVVGHQFGNGSGKQAMTALGAIGGAVAGNEVEKSQRKSTRYDVVVRMEEGGNRTISATTPPPFSNGDRVRVTSEGGLVHAN